MTDDGNRSARSKIFISHATPDDNDFAVWLASRLSLAGYSAWIDTNALYGGVDFWRTIEQAIRYETVKFVVALSPTAIQRDGVMKEIAVAATVGKQMNDPDFIIPLRIGGLSFSAIPVDLHRLNAIDFDNGWTSGLSDLLETLNKANLSKSEKPETEVIEGWRKFHTQKAKLISETPETLISNLLPILKLPEKLNFYELRRPTNHSGEIQRIASDSSVPAFAFNRYVGTFAGVEEIQEAVGQDAPMKLHSQVDVHTYLSGECSEQPISQRDARNQITGLLRKAWDRAMQTKGLIPQAMADGTCAWWFPDGLVQGNKLPVRKEGKRLSSRSVIGSRNRKSGVVFWHLGFSSRPMLNDEPQFLLKPRVMVSEDKKNPIDDKKRRNVLRKAICKLWFNATWRDQMIGFVQWLANGEEEFRMPLAADATCTVDNKLTAFVSPVSILGNAPEGDDEEDATEDLTHLSDPAFLSPGEDEMEEE